MLMVVFLDFRSIGRIIFYSLKKKNMNDKGEIEFSTISVSQALQIAGRAGRFGTKYEIVSENLACLNIVARKGFLNFAAEG